MNSRSKMPTTRTSGPGSRVHSNSTFIVLKPAQLEQGRVVYGETHLFVGPNFLVSVQHGASSSYAQVIERGEERTHLAARGPGFALYAVMDFVVDNYQPIVTQIEKDCARNFKRSVESPGQTSAGGGCRPGWLGSGGNGACAVALA